MESTGRGAHQTTTPPADSLATVHSSLLCKVYQSRKPRVRAFGTLPGLLHYYTLCVWDKSILKLYVHVCTRL